jgi:hypothetical protein
VVLVGGYLVEGVISGEMNLALTQKVQLALLAVAEVQTVAKMALSAVEPVEKLPASVPPVVALGVVGPYFLLLMRLYAIDATPVPSPLETRLEPRRYLRRLARAGKVYFLHAARPLEQVRASLLALLWKFDLLPLPHR